MFLTPDDTHNFCVICLGKDHAHLVLEGAVFVLHVLCAFLNEKASLLSVPLVQAPVPRGSGPALTEAGRRLRSWESQVELAEEFERAINLLRSSVADERELLEEDVLSLTCSDPASSALLASSQGEQVVADEGEEVEMTEPSQPPCPVYIELLEVMECATTRLELLWQREKEETACGRLDERFLSGHNRPAPVSLAFLPDLHIEIEKAWKNLYSACIHQHQHANYTNVKGVSIRVDAPYQ